MPLLLLEDINLAFGGVKAINDVTVRVGQGPIHAIIGPNGPRQDSVFNCISGGVPAQGGKILFEDRPFPG